MNRQIRRLGIAITVAFAVVFAQLNIIQVFRADAYRDNPANTREVQREFNRDRGLIITADGVVAAETVSVGETDIPGGSFDRVRRYPRGPLLAQVTGYYSFLFGATGVERTYNAELLGDTFGQQLAGWRDLLVERPTVGDVHLSVRADLTEVAADALGERPGSVVVLEPATGRVLTMWSYPSFDPNGLSSTDLPATQLAWDALTEAAGNPLLGRAYQETYFPGSTFKVVTAGNGLRTGAVSDTEPVYPVEATWVPPLTDRPITNFGDSACGGSLIPILEVSCNTAFARMGVDTIGPDDMVAGSEAFGFNSAPPIDLPNPAASSFPTEFERDLPRLAQASIGQNDVLSTPLQMALVAAAVGNGGDMMQPLVAERVTDATGGVVGEIRPSVWQRPLDASDAATLRDAMVDVVRSGTATVLAGAGPPGTEVGAKTGTAQLGTEPPRQHTWIIAFAGPPGGPAEVAVAVAVLDQTGDATGSSVAGPVARQVLDAALSLPSRPGR